LVVKVPGVVYVFEFKLVRNESKDKQNANSANATPKSPADATLNSPSANSDNSSSVNIAPNSPPVVDLRFAAAVSEALWQIDNKGYLVQFAVDGRRLVKVGVAFGEAERNIVAWQALG
jgi:hypothetical protein